MKYLKTVFSLLLMLGMGLVELQAQEVLTTTGGNATGSGGSVSYSVGQSTYTTNFGTTGSVAQGVQQPFEISVISGTNDIDGISLNCTAFPNPTTAYITLKIDNLTVENLSYQIYDITAKLIESKRIAGSETRIEVGYLIPAIYIIKVSQENKIVKTFKIVKK